MKDLWNQLFLELFPSSMYRDASQMLYQMDTVQYVKGEIQGDQRYIEGKVVYLKKTYLCQIYLSSQLALMRYNCSCASEKCLHIGAVLLFLMDMDPSGFPFNIENPKFTLKQRKIDNIADRLENRRLTRISKTSRNLISAAKEKYLRQLEDLLIDEKVELKPALAWDGDAYPTLNFRIGKKTFYILKDLGEFIERIEEHLDYSYGKNLHFVHSVTAFSEPSRKQVELIEEAVNQRNDGYYSSYYTYGRDLKLDDSLMDQFFDIYKELDTEGFHCEVSSEKISIQVDITEKTYTFSIHLNQAYYPGLKNYYRIESVNNDVMISCYPLDEEGKTMDFIKLVQKEPLIVLKQEYPDFYKYYLSDIEQYLDIDSEVIEIEDYPYIQLYADIDQNDQAAIWLKCYNENNLFRLGFNHDYISGYRQDLIEQLINKYAYEIDYENHRAYIRTDSENFFDFFQDILPRLSEYCEIYVSDELKKIGTTQHYSIAVGVRLSNGLLEIDVDSPDIPKEELGQVLNAYRRKKKFYRLKNGKLLPLASDDLKELDDFASDYQIPPSEISTTAKVPSFRMLDLENKEAELDHITLQRDQLLDNAMKSWYEDHEDKNRLLPKYQKLLRSYQKTGVQWMSKLHDYQFSGILADDMGLGKTLQVIALLESLDEKGVNLVVCPASLIYNWEEEIHKFSSGLKTCCITGNADQRRLLLAQYRDYDLLITSYDYIKRDIELYDSITFNYVILDEAQYIKNPKTKNASSVKKLQAVHRLALTGTPIENSLAELWSIFDFLMPGYLYNYHYFQSHYESDIVKYKNLEKQTKLRKLVSPFILRRNKTEVLTELPEKIETNYLIDFSEEEKKIYYANLAQVNEELAAMSNIETSDKMVILKMLMRLRQLCCEPRLLYENIETPSSKLQACMELIENLKENNKKALLFSSFTSMLDLIAEELTKKHISFKMLTGSTNKEDRRELVNQFQNDETTIFLISLKAGGTGLNLTAAEAVIHYDPWWNVSAQNQATDRAYRIGQNKNVQVFKMIMKNSIEEKIQQLQVSKKDLADAFVEGNTGTISQMSKDEIMSLFKMNETD